MRVLLSPRAAAGLGEGGPDVARLFAGPEGSVVSLLTAGALALGRVLTAAEVSAIRQALSPDEVRQEEEPVVGYVCRGVRLGGGVTQAVAVSDHVNLTWRSPLTGPNDDRLGPRFPSMSRIYAPEAVMDRVGAASGIIVEVGVVAGVDDEDRLGPFDAEVAAGCGCAAASRELVSVGILAAHLGLRVAALVVTAGYEQEETHSGRS